MSLNKANRNFLHLNLDRFSDKLLKYILTCRDSGGMPSPTVEYRVGLYAFMLTL